MRHQKKNHKKKRVKQMFLNNKKMSHNFKKASITSLLTTVIE